MQRERPGKEKAHHNDALGSASSEELSWMDRPVFSPQHRTAVTLYLPILSA